MRPRHASRRVSRSRGRYSCPACICITFLQFRSLWEQNLSSCPAYSFPSYPPHVPKSRSPLNLLLPTRHRPQKDTPAFPSAQQLLPSPPVSLRLSASPTCCWWMKTLHASAPEVSYRQEGDCNGIPTICMARLYRWARTQVGFLSLDGFHLHLVGSPLFWVG